MQSGDRVISPNTANVPLSQVTQPMPDTDLACLAPLASFHGIAVNPNQLWQRFVEFGKPASDTEILLEAKHLNLRVGSIGTDWLRLGAIPLPAIADYRDRCHVLVARVDEERY